MREDQGYEKFVGLTTTNSGSNWTSGLKVSEGAVDVVRVTNFRPPQLSSPRRRGSSNNMNLLWKYNSHLTVYWIPAFAGMTSVVVAVAAGTTFGSDTQDEEESLAEQKLTRSSYKINPARR